MSGMLASVSNLDEALLVEGLNVDIIDLKQPARGALGALSTDEVSAIVAALMTKTRISATVGDLPMQPELVSDAVVAMAATGVDLIKIGLFPGGNWQGCIDRLGKIGIRQSLIAVLFADTQPDFAIIEKLSQAGFAGVMLDTMEKRAGSLTQLLSQDQLSQFVLRASEFSLTTGLAGSLREADIDALLPLGADYLGFRGALCSKHQRTGSLEPEKIASIRRRIHSGR